MGICKFWAQGNCRFGEKCWNDHPSGGQQRQNFNDNQTTDNRNKQSNSILLDNKFTTLESEEVDSSTSFQNRPQNFQNNFKVDRRNLNNEWNKSKQQTSKSQVLLETVLSELQAWVSGKQWPFSTFSVLFHEKIITIPGFFDLSMEELRWEAYKAMQQNSQAQYENEFQRLQNDCETKCQVLMNISVERLVQMITSSSVTQSQSLEFFKPGTFESPVIDANTEKFQSSSSEFFKSGTCTSPIAPSSSNSFSFRLDDTPKVEPVDSFSFNQKNNQPNPSSSAFSFSLKDHPSVQNSSTPKQFVSSTSSFHDHSNAGFQSPVVHSKTTEDKDLETNPYSKIDDLNPKQIEHFKASKFKLGEVPTLPPTIEFCR